MTDAKDRFLEAEELATRLARQLLELKEKIGAHQEAAKTLDTARESLSSLAGEMNEISKRLPQVIAALSEIDTSAILQAIETTKQDLAALEKAESEKISRLLKIAIVIASVGTVGLIILIVLTMIR